MSDQYKAIVLNQEGENFKREIKTIDKSFLKHGDVTVKVDYSDLNFKDGMILKNGGRLVKEFPHIPGIDFAGTVVESKSDKFKEGDEIIQTGWRVGEIFYGGYSQYAKVDSNFLVKKPKKIDVIYRRIDDKFLDPLSYDNSSLIGIPGLFDSYKSQNLTIASAPGSGIADDKAIYSFMPDIIKFYLGEKPILNNIMTYSCYNTENRKYVLDNIHKLVIKEVHGAGGYGMLIGDRASKTNIDLFKKKINKNPSGYIAQPILDLSTVPIFDNANLSERHVDFRPFCLVVIINKTSQMFTYFSY